MVLEHLLLVNYQKTQVILIDKNLLVKQVLKNKLTSFDLFFILYESIRKTSKLKITSEP